eukprot:TRINITY_DN283_c0_g1_i3.p1 TRINITY_DN283_c0_g1~~TRINITY_DN283_c0_g1_i3.p1  ORF type:complete len:269 (+),score=66.90 TRINITY_DN283_c0_g1_i3:152-958(+)
MAMSIDTLLEMVEKISIEVGDVEAGDKEPAPKDPFKYYSGLVSQTFAKIKQLIADRDRATQEEPGSIQAIQLSQQIRQEIRHGEEAIGKMKKAHEQAVETYRKQNKGKPPVEDQEKQIANRDEMIRAALDGLKECQELSTRRLAGPDLIPIETNRDVPKELPNIDDSRFQALIQRDAELDAILDQIGEGVATLKALALEMNKEAHTQEALIDEMGEKVSLVTKEIRTMNKDMKELLVKLRSPASCIITIVLIVLLLALGGLIYFLIMF